MNNDELILAELRKISAWADMQRKVSKWSLVFVAVFLPALLIFLGVMAWMANANLKTNLENIAAPEPSLSWYDVDRSVSRGDFDAVIQVGEELVSNPPLCPEAHSRLARVYLAAGNVDKAKEHYAESFRLFPSEENEKRLKAINKRSQAENSKPVVPKEKAPSD